jgi:RES domain
MRHLRRGGEYLRVADPEWEDPLDGGYAAIAGGRWNPPASFPVVYLCASVAVARANVHRRLAGQPYGPEDLEPATAPLLVAARVREDRFVDAVSDAGCRSLGLPKSFPRDSRGRLIGHDRCQPIGEAAWDAGEPGIAARSAAPGAPRGGEELAFFSRRRRLRRGRTVPFEDWFW